MTDAKTIRNLLDRHWGPLLAWVGARDEAAEDIVQQAFIALSSESRLPENPVAWLYKTARNLAINEHKKRRRRVRRHQQVAKPEKQPMTAWPTAEANELMDMLDCLPDVQRTVLVARIWGGLNLDEVAFATQKSRATVWRNYQAAISTLRKRYGITCEIEP